MALLILRCRDLESILRVFLGQFVLLHRWVVGNIDIGAKGSVRKKKRLRGPSLESVVLFKNGCCQTLQRSGQGI